MFIAAAVLAFAIGMAYTIGLMLLDSKLKDRLPVHLVVLYHLDAAALVGFSFGLVLQRTVLPVPEAVSICYLYLLAGLTLLLMCGKLGKISNMIRDNVFIRKDK